jgi:signal transduction histidine kinase
MEDGFERITARFLTVRYLVALAVMGALLLAAQVVVQRVLASQAQDGQVINLVGRQRMLCEELAKATLAWRSAATPEARATALAEVARARGEWMAAESRFPGGDEPAAVAAAWARLQPVFATMAASAADLERDPGASARLLAAEGDFLRQMEGMVGLYQAEARAHVRRMMVLEYAICALMLLVLVAEALLVFRPAVRRLRRAIADHERLRERLALDRELTTVAAVTRDIGLDLHDGVGQTLTALALNARALETALRGHAVEPRLAALRTGIGEALKQVRAAAHLLCPVDIHETGIEAALQGLVASTRAIAGVDCRAECAPGLAPAGGEDLYRIAQEAVANALRHGRARSITIAITADGAAGRLEIDDDGVGGAPPAGDGIGLRSMRHRASRIGGTLEAGPRRDGGWRVACTFPVAAEPRR